MTPVASTALQATHQPTTASYVRSPILNMVWRKGDKRHGRYVCVVQCPQPYSAKFSVVDHVLVGKSCCIVCVGGGGGGGGGVHREFLMHHPKRFKYRPTLLPTAA